MGKRNRSKSSPNVNDTSVKRPAMASNTFNTGGGPGLSPSGQQGQFCMPPTYKCVPQYTNLSPGPMPMNQTPMQNQQTVDFMTQLLQRLDLMDQKLVKLEVLQSSVSTVTTRVNSVDQKVSSLEAKLLDIEKSRELDSKSLEQIHKDKMKWTKF